MNKIIKEFRKQCKAQGYCGAEAEDIISHAESFTLDALSQQKKETIDELVEYIREKSLLSSGAKAEMIGYLRGMEIRPKNKETKKYLDIKEIVKVIEGMKKPVAPGLMSSWGTKKE